MQPCLIESHLVLKLVKLGTFKKKHEKNLLSQVFMMKEIFQMYNFSLSLQYYKAVFSLYHFVFGIKQIVLGSVAVNVGHDE